METRRSGWLVLAVVVALAFVLRHRCVATAIIGASRMSQIADCQAVDANMSLDDEELAAILDILG